MSIITIASTKGGVGKSTFLINLATHIQNQGKKVAILDGDKQNTISKWNKVREYIRTNGDPFLTSLFVVSAVGNSLLEIAESKKNQGYIVLIDTPGVDDPNMRTALLRSDYIITPCPPSAVDLWEIDTLNQLLKQLRRIQNRKIPLIIVLNKVPTIHSSNYIEDVQNFLDDNNILHDFLLKSYLKERIVFKHAIREGKGVSEYTPYDMRAIKEVENCHSEIMMIIKDKYS